MDIATEMGFDVVDVADDGQSLLPIESRWLGVWATNRDRILAVVDPPAVGAIRALRSKS
jgi:hypothetical protein